MPNSQASASFRASSIVVPSMAVTSRSFHRDVIPRSASLRSASSSKILRMACSPSSLRAWDSALPAGTPVPGLNRRPGSLNAFASTAS